MMVSVKQLQDAAGCPHAVDLLHKLRMLFAMALMWRLSRWPGPSALLRRQSGAGRNRSGAGTGFPALHPLCSPRRTGID